MNDEIIFYVFFLLCSHISFAQKDTVIGKSKKGLLFLSQHNYKYDWDVLNEMRHLGFHDFFLPTDSVGAIDWYKKDSGSLFTHALRVDFVPERYDLKKKAQRVVCIDSTRCYAYDNFYIIPVVVDYGLFTDYEPPICGRSYFSLQIGNGNLFRVEYISKAIKLLKVLSVKHSDIK
ncbi:hypothetical protein [Niabella hibiscisoli]|uniref:hypothetical protein n=1 Tax=Niabella hibiscisoli TaxID=1825928 RepID=UPI001F0DEF01|nr:hypothetical protein [Niabella hibiscisoli]MCH5720509.1 hypothetical protein [Niabella hibiscisoli]